MSRLERLLTVNAGSTSLKLSVVDGDGVQASEEVARDGPTLDVDGLRTFVAAGGAVDAVVHRVVHGGPTHAAAAALTPAVIADIESLSSLAPLHQPPGLAGIHALSPMLPATPAYACFDTAFFHHLPEAARTYALPREWNEAHGLRRYGFHGLSHAYAARRVHDILDKGHVALRVVTCHLGGGASLAAVRGDTALDTTMGFTPLEGLVMGTRSGDVDPGLLLWLQTARGLDAAEVGDALEHRSGLRGLAGTADMREVIRDAGSGVATARLARDVYIHRLCKQIAAMTAVLGGVDAVVFTGGIGEHDGALRAEVGRRLEFLGLGVDPTMNEADGDRVISGAGAATDVVVVGAHEDLEMARQVRLLTGGP